MSIEDYDDREPEFGLVLPFKCVRSVGGVYDDEAFVAGFQIGSFDAHLAPRILAAGTRLFYEGLIEQADLVAMNHGYTTDVLHLADGWAHIGFTRVDPAPLVEGTDR